MTAIDDKFNEIAEKMAAPDADPRKRAFWNDLVANGKDIIEQANIGGWESEPEPKGWKEKLIEAIGDGGLAMSAAPMLPRYMREQVRQDVKKQVIDSFEKGPTAPKPVL